MYWLLAPSSWRVATRNMPQLPLPHAIDPGGLVAWESTVWCNVISNSDYTGSCPWSPFTGSNFPSGMLTNLAWGSAKPSGNLASRAGNGVWLYQVIDHSPAPWDYLQVPQAKSLRTQSPSPARRNALLGLQLPRACCFGSNTASLASPLRLGEDPGIYTSSSHSVGSERVEEGGEEVWEGGGGGSKQDISPSSSCRTSSSSSPSLSSSSVSDSSLKRSDWSAK